MAWSPGRAETMFLSHTPECCHPRWRLWLGAGQAGVSSQTQTTSIEIEWGREEVLNAQVRDNDTQLQFREKHRAQVLHHLISYCALDLLFQMPFGILLPDVPCLELVGGQRGLLLHRLVVRF